MVAFVDKHRDEYEVEPICDVLPIAPSTYYEHRSRAVDPDLRPEREKRDEELRLKIERVWNDNYAVYGVPDSSPSVTCSHGGLFERDDHREPARDRFRRAVDPVVVARSADLGMHALDATPHQGLASGEQRSR